MKSIATLIAVFLSLSSAHAASVPKRAWWQKGVIYQVYPRSFQDSNGDGVGDLNGITRRLPYLKLLGVDAIWISPFYPSPMKDFGYDISDYRGVDRQFGTLADFDKLCLATHAEGMKIILDLVPNHSSDEHPWFKESRASKENAKRDWYVWRAPGPGGGPPNGWLSVFGGSAWELDKTTGQYYYHAFLAQQPDLNYRNPEVKKAMLEVMRFWLDRGADGFRVDAIDHLVEDETLSENPPNPNYTAKDPEFDKQSPVHTVDLPETRAFVREMRKVVDGYADRVLLTEAYLPLKQQVAYYGDGAGAQLPFNFHLIKSKWTAAAVGKLAADYEAILPPDAWPNWVLGNHDRSRLVSRIGKEQARVAAMLLFTLRGTPTTYYGDELEMSDVPISLEKSQDPAEKREPGKGLGRDPQRTPMPWDTTPNAGFTSGTPWLPLGSDWMTRNVAVEEKERGSPLKLYKALLKLRRSEKALSEGAYAGLPQAGDVFAFERYEGQSRFLVILNFSNHTQTFPLSGRTGAIVLSTFLDHARLKVRGKMNLRANEGLIIRMGNMLKPVPHER